MQFKPLFGSLIIGLIIWSLTAYLLALPKFILPSPLHVFYAFEKNYLSLLHHSGVTLFEIILGLILGSLIGIMVAFSLYFSAFLRHYFLPILIFSQTIPVFALAPILTLWFGYGIASKILMTILIIFFPIASNFYDGLARTPKDMLDLAQVMGASKWQKFKQISIPYALPNLASGLKLAAVYAPIGAIIGEWVGASEGLGYLMLLANGRVKTDLMFASLICLALMAILLHALISFLAKKLEDYSRLK